MSSSPAGGSRVRVLGLLIGLVALLTAFGLASIASGASDTVKSGSATLSLKSKTLKFKPKGPKLTATGGSVDPTNVAGNLTVTGSTKVTPKKGKKKVKIDFTKVDLTGGGSGSIDAKVKGKSVAKCFTFSGGTVGRSGFDGTVSNGKLKISKACVKKINKASKGGKGKKGSVGKLSSLSETPATDTITSGTATLKFDPVALIKLSAHGALPNGDNGPAAPCSGGFAAANPFRCGNGVNAIGPATLDSSTATFTFPLVGGALAPDGSAGQIKLGGGIDLKKVNASCDTGTGGVIQAGGGPACATTGGRFPSPPAPQPTACNNNNSEIAITDIVVDFSSKVSTATATITVPIAPSNNQTLSNAPLATLTVQSVSANGAARSFTGNATLVNTVAGAGAENSVLGSSATPAAQGGPCNDPANDFAPNSANATPDPIGVANFTAQGQ